MAYIVVVAGPHREEVKPVFMEVCFICRGEPAADRLNLGNDEYVSRGPPHGDGHAAAQIVDGSWRLTDRGSTNKTWVILNGAFHPLAAGAFVGMRRAFLFGCGMSGLLFLDLGIGEEPSTSLVKDLCDTNHMESGHPADAPGVTTLLEGTETNTTPLADRAASLARWAQVTAVLNKHGLGRLL